MYTEGEIYYKDQKEQEQLPSVSQMGLNINFSLDLSEDFLSSDCIPPFLFL